jgi:hypothetical protein
MEMIKVMFAAIASSAVVTASIVGIARPLSRIARHLVIPGQSTSKAYVETAHTATR